jgi:2-C-methyl-D-erythritol 4-phosphate cytidylyltransferase/2-C-methyl-D-erythritol 2,4-cyclodiphosphate synthase
MRDLAVVLVAAGKGERLGQNIPKAFVELAGRTLLEHALVAISGSQNLLQVVIAAPESHLEQAREIAAGIGADGFHIDVVQGGVSRQGSIANALAAVDFGAEVVLVHDAARCFAPATLFDRVAQAVREGLEGSGGAASGTGVSGGAGVVPVLPVADTIKVAAAEEILETVDRDHLRIAQTPQGFPSQTLKAAYAAATTEFTDDASLYQAYGQPVISVIGDAQAHKITVPSDLVRAAADAVSKAGAASALTRDFSNANKTFRSGIGTDTHRFATDGRKPLILAGIEWPNEIALDGHSDGDAVAHAVVDALLSAAALGDIGGNFGVDRPEYAGASGEVFIRGTLELLAQHGWSVENVSVQVIGNRPKLSPQREAAQARMTQLVGAPVTIGATTTDGLGFLGNSQGVAAVATALISSTSKVG